MVVVRKADDQDVGAIRSMVDEYASELGLPPVEISGCQCWIAELDGRAVGVVGVIDTEDAVWGQFMWVHPEHRDGGIGGLLHRAAFRSCNGRPARVVAEIGRAPIYTKIGYRVTHYVMEKMG